MKQTLILFLFLLNFLLSQNVLAQELSTVTDFISYAIQKNKPIVTGVSKPITEEQFNFLFENYSTNEIYNSNFVGLSITNLLNPGKLLKTTDTSITVSSNNGSSAIDITADPDEDENITQIPAKTLSPILPYIDDQKKEYLIILEKKLSVPVKSKVNKATFIHYPILSRKAAFQITSDKAPYQTTLSKTEINELISIVKMAKSKKLKSKSNIEYKTEFAKDLISKLLVVN